MNMKMPDAPPHMADPIRHLPVFPGHAMGMAHVQTDAIAIPSGLIEDPGQELRLIIENVLDIAGHAGRQALRKSLPDLNGTLMVPFFMVEKRDMPVMQDQIPDPQFPAKGKRLVIALVHEGDRPGIDR